MNKTLRVLKKKMSTQSHWKEDNITDKIYSFIFNYIQINIQVIGIFFTDKMGSVTSRKKRSIAN